MAKADTTTSTPRVQKTAAERLQTALAGFAPVEEASVSQAQVQRETAERTVRNAFAGVVGAISPENFGSDQEDAVAKAFSSLKRSQTAFLKAVKATSDEDASKLPGVVSDEAVAEGDFEVTE